MNDNDMGNGTHRQTDASCEPANSPGLRTEWTILSILVVIGWLLLAGFLGFLRSGFDWTRKEGNAGAVQAITALVTLFATLALLGVTWWQARIARDASARELHQMREAQAAAWESSERDRRLAEEAADAARREAFEARRNERERTERAVMPMLVWRDFAIASPDGAISRVAFVLSNAGGGPAVMAHLYVGSGDLPKSTEYGYFTLGPGREMDLSVEVPGHPPKEKRSKFFKAPEPPYDVPGHFVAQLFAVYRDIYGNRFGSRVDFYFDMQGKRFVLAPVVFEKVHGTDDAIHTLRSARFPRPI